MSPVSPAVLAMQEEMERRRLAKVQAENMASQQGLMARLGMGPKVNEQGQPTLMTPNQDQAINVEMQKMVNLQGAPARENFMRGMAEVEAATAAQAPRNALPEPTFMNRVGAAIGDRVRDPAWRARMAAALNNMTVAPNPTFQQAMLNRSQGIVQGRQKAQSEQRIGNATVDYLRKQGMTDLAALVEKEPTLSTAVMSYLLRDPKQAPAVLQQYALWKAEGNEGGLNEFLTLARPTTTIDLGTPQNKALTQNLEKYMTSASTASNSLQALGYLQMLGGTVATGPFEQTKATVRALAASLGVPVDETQLGNAQQLEAFTNNLVAEELRKNKGPQTDFDAQFSKSFLPSLGDTPEAFQMKLKYLRSRNLRDVLIGNYVNDNITFDDTTKDLATRKQASKYDLSIPSVTQVEGQYLTLADFYEQGRNDGLNDQQILDEWFDLTKGDLRR